MAVTYDATGAGASNYSGSTASMTLSWSHTASGTARAVIVIAQARELSNAAFGAVTYGGTTMTQLAAMGWNNSTNGQLAFFGLLNPATGAKTVSVTANSTSFTSSMYCQSFSFNNVNSFGTAVTASGATTSMSVTGSATSNDMLFGGFGSNDSNATTGFNQTQKWSAVTTQSVTIGGIATGAASTTFSATQNAASVWAGIVVPVNGIASAKNGGFFYGLGQ